MEKSTQGLYGVYGLYREEYEKNMETTYYLGFRVKGYQPVCSQNKHGPC